jgi:hypothetical protein
MSRFSKGTMDHDGDGRRGGSRKGTNMAKKKTAKKTPEDFGAIPDKAAKKSETEAQFAEADAKGRPETQEEREAREAEELRVGLQVRGY